MNESISFSAYLSLCICAPSVYLPLPSFTLFIPAYWILFFLFLLSVCNEELTHQMKGRTVMDEHERYEAVRHCRYVDELITDAPWTITDEFLEKHKVNRKKNLRPEKHMGQLLVQNLLPYTSHLEIFVFSELQ